MNLTAKRRIYLLIINLLFIYPGLLKADASEDDRMNDSLRNKLALCTVDTTRVKLLNKLADQLRNQHPALALEYSRRALKIADSVGYGYGKADAYNCMGVLAYVMGDYRNALFYYLRALRLAETLGNGRFHSITLSNVGTIYIRLKKFDIAEKHFSEALKLMTELGLKHAILNVYNNLGIIKMEQGKLDECIGYYKMSFENGMKYNKEGADIAAPLMNLGEAYIRLKQPRIAEYYYRRALQISISRNNTYYLVDGYHSLGKLYIERGDFAKAEKNLFKAKGIAEHSGITTSLAGINKDISVMYMKRGDFKKAYQYSERFHTLKDSASSEILTQQISEMQAKYETEKKDKEIEVLNKDKTISEAKNRREILLRNSSIIAFFLILTTCFILVRNIRQKKKIFRIIERQRGEIEKKNNELNMFNKELMKENISAKYEVLKSKTNPHFLFNSLSTLSSIVVKDQQSAVEYIERFSDLYRMVLTTGDQQLISLEQEMKVVNHYLYLQKMRFGENLSVDIDISYDRSYVVLPFAIQMVAENAIKHNIISRLRKLNIAIFMEDGNIVIKNNLQKKYTNVVSTLTGQKSIIDRYELVTDKQPLFIQTETAYEVKLPVIVSEELMTVKEGEINNKEVAAQI